MALSEVSVGNYCTVMIGSTEVGEIESLGGISQDTTIVQFNQYNKKYSRALVGSSSTAPIEITCTYLPSDAGQTALEEARKSEAREEFSITYHTSAGATAGKEFTFWGYVASRNISSEYDAQRTVTYSIAIDGDIAEADVA